MVENVFKAYSAFRLSRMAASIFEKLSEMFAPVKAEEEEEEEEPAEEPAEEEEDEEEVSINRNTVR